MEKQASTTEKNVFTACAIVFAPIARLVLPLFVLLPAVTSFAYLRYGWIYAAVIAVCSTAAIGALWGPVNALAYALLVLPGACAIMNSLARKRSVFESLVISCALFLLGALALHYCIIALKGKDFIALLFDAINTQIQAIQPDTPQAYSLDWMYVVMGAGTTQAMENFLVNGSSGVPLEEVVQRMLLLIQGLENELRLMMPYLFSLFAMIAGLVNQLLCRLALKHRGYALAPFPPLRKMRMPRAFNVGAAVLLLILFGNSFGIPGFMQAYSTVGLTLSFIFAIQGLALLDWLLYKRMGRGARIVLDIVAAVLLSGFILPYMGIFDQLFNIRKPKDKTA